MPASVLYAVKQRQSLSSIRMNTSIRPCESDLKNHPDLVSCVKLPYIKHNSNDAMISIGRKLFDEVDIPRESKIISDDAITKTLQRESSWTAEINGINPFPNRIASVVIY